MRSTIHHVPRTARLIGAVAAVLLLFSVEVRTAVPVRAAKPDGQDAVQVFARDVFVIEGASLRNPDDTTADDAPLFNVAGVALNLTWGAWKHASAQATAHVIGGPNKPSTEVRIRLSGLVPGGVYSLFYGTLTPDSENPLCPGVERTLPLISRDKRQAPDASSFVADAQGRADFTGEVDGRLLDAMQVFFSAVYHFDGQTYGSLPNRGEFLTQGAGCHSSFGEDAMRQILILQQW